LKTEFELGAKKVNPALLVTISGPVLGAVGWYSHFTWLFWVGVALCAITLFLNVASGVMKLPVLPVLFMVVAAAVLNPWYVGLGVGLLIWTVLESVGEVIGLKKEGRSRVRHPTNESSGRSLRFGLGPPLNHGVGPATQSLEYLMKADDGVVKPDHSLLSMDLDDPRILAELERIKERRRRIGRIVGFAIDVVIGGVVGGATVLLLQEIRDLF
jgi:hypothetical protein